MEYRPFVILIIFFIVRCQIISLNDALTYSLEGQPTNCAVWNGKICEKCDEGFYEEMGVCRQSTEKAINKTIQNIQFQGPLSRQAVCDEVDVLKIDGIYIYTVSGQQLSISVSGTTKNAQALVTLQFDNFNPSGILIQGNYLAVIGIRQQIQDIIKSQTITRTYVKILNIENKRSPKQIREFWIDGNYVSGRNKDGFVYIFTQVHQPHGVYKIPQFNFNGTLETVSSKNIYYKITEFSDPFFFNIFSFDLRNPISSQKKMVSIINERFQALYMNQNALYVSFLDYSLSEATSIVKVYLNKNEIIPLADARLKGLIKDQFWIDQYSQFLRVVTTSNKIYSFDSFMNQIGFLEGLAPGQELSSANFVNRRLFLTTWKKEAQEKSTNLLIISFEDHKLPKIKGKISIAGFSKHLYSLNENITLTIGSQTAQGAGIVVSIVDTRNDDLKEIYHYKLQGKYADSNILWERNSILFSKQRNLLVISGNSQNQGFNGAFVFHIDQQRVQLKGVINHFEHELPFSKATIDRIFYISEWLYTKSTCILKTNKISNISDVKNIIIIAKSCIIEGF